MQTDWGTLNANINRLSLNIGDPGVNKVGDNFGLIADINGCLYSSTSWLTPPIFAVKWLISGFKPQAADLDAALRNLLSKTFNQAVTDCYRARIQKIYLLVIDLKQNTDDTTLFDGELLKTFLIKLDGLKKHHLTAFESIYESVALDNKIKLRDLRATVHSFHEAIYDFWMYFFEQNKIKKLKYQETPVFDQLCTWIKPQDFINSRLFFLALRSEGDWVAFEGLSDQKVPLIQFVKMLTSSLNKKDQLVLKEWTKSANELKNYYKTEVGNELKDFISTLFSVLEQSIAIIQLIYPSFDLLDLVYCLNNYGLNMLSEIDYRQLQWRDDAIEKKAFICNGIKFTLGSAIGEKEGLDRFKCFEVEKHPNWIVEFPINRFESLVKIKDFESTKKHWGINFVKVVEEITKQGNKILPGMDKQGQCVIVERLQMLSNYQWTSTEFHLDDRDSEIALILNSHIYSAHVHDGFFNLSFNVIGRDLKGRLKSIRPLCYQLGDYVKWENKCVELSQGNNYVLNDLIYVSELFKHPAAKFLRKEINNAIDYDEVLLRADSDLHYEHDKDSYYKLANELVDKVRALKISIKEWGFYGFKLYESQSKKEVFDSRVSRLLNLYYNHQPLASQLPLEEDIKKSLKEEEEPRLPEIPLKYYEEKTALMLKYNESCP